MKGRRNVGHLWESKRFLGKKKQFLEEYCEVWEFVWLPRWLKDKDSTCQCRRHRRCEFNPWVGKIPRRKKWQPTPVFLPEKFHGRRSLVSYSPWDRKESDTTKQLHFYLQKKQNKTKHSPGVFTHDKTIFYLGVKYLCTVEGVQDRHLKVCCFGVLIILSWRYLKHSPYRESSLNSPICLKTDSPKGTQLP